ncbi:ATP-binding response regulator [Thiothrix nivea]|uniref:histidine kinase n=1 Tax=Thiothrix nivea (strain ATCC 35100 / DSM 5205 / JP2) TaxID=870187 RepID=A0A656HGA8_THINJ|nr:hybrid sensor histidine kinase/response regulator [Thiothrix nivea]EIJ34065.1 integral membrane sensor hybrid histidine kinase [Thiothrix nivea DSM 5205]
MPDSPEHAIQHEKLRLLYRNLKASLPGNLVVCFILNGVFWEEVSQAYIVGWALSLKALLLARYLDYRQFWSGQFEKLPTRYWEWRFTAGTALTGVMWGILFTLFLMPEKPDYVLFILGIYTILITIANITTAARMPAFLAFLLPTSLPLIVSLLWVGETLYTVMGISFLMFVAVNVFICHIYSRNIHRTIKLQIENAQLIQRLENEKYRAEKNQSVAEQAMQAKDKFLAAASHDLRQPLHTQGLYLDAIESFVHPKGVGHLGALRKTNAALSSLFDSLLDVSRLNAGIVEAAPIHVCLNRVLLRLRDEFQPHAARKGLFLKLECENLPVFTDPVLLERIVRNLLANAIRYTHAGVIALSCHQVGKDQVRVLVSDTGIGIPEHEQPHIFDEYYQLDNPERDRSKGLGLGLAIVKKLCQLLDISITCQSAVGEGSTFTLHVPLGDAELVRQERKPAQIIPLEGVRVLVIDDEPDILASMGHLLGSWGCLPITAESATEALQTIDRSGLQPDLIIADYRLRAGQTGAEAIATIHRHCQRAIPAMIVTGDTSRERLREANASGLYLLHKPVAPGQLRATMNQLIKA